MSNANLERRASYSIDGEPWVYRRAFLERMRAVSSEDMAAVNQYRSMRKKPPLDHPVEAYRRDILPVESALLLGPYVGSSEPPATPPTEEELRNYYTLLHGWRSRYGLSGDEWMWVNELASELWCRQPDDEMDVADEIGSLFFDLTLHGPPDAVAEWSHALSFRFELESEPLSASWATCPPWNPMAESPADARKRILAEFGPALDAYLERIEQLARRDGVPISQKRNTRRDPAGLWQQMDWLIYKRCFGLSWKRLATRFDQHTSTMRKGVERMKERLA